MRKLALLLSIFITLLSAGPSFAELTEDQAFHLETSLKSGSLDLKWEIAPKHYLYKKQLSLKNEKNESLLDDKILPKGKLIKDSVLGEYEVYAKQLNISVPLPKNKSDTKMLLRYQGCAEGGFCYLPITKEITIGADQNINVADSELVEFPTVEVDGYDSNDLASMLADSFLPMTLIIFFCLGILLSFTPCVLPMIPIIVNLIVGPKQISSRKAFMLASSYVIGMAACYTIAGIIAGLLGATLQAWLQQPLILISLSILLVILALGQFEIIHISLPTFNNRLHSWSQQQLQGSFIGAFFLGLISALIVSPCITPPLIGALTYISQHGNPLIGGLALLSLGLGMGVPLIIVAMLSSMILPKAGEWMNIVKTFAGLTLLGLAIWLLQRIIPLYAALVLWGTLCIITAVMLKAFEPIKQPRKITKAFKLLGVLLSLFGAALIMNTVYMQFIAKPNNEHALVRWHDINTVAELEESLAIARKNQQYTLLEFYAYWCTSCKRIEATVFSDPEVVRNLAQFNLLRVDMTKMDPIQKPIMSLLKIYGPPAILFFDTKGQEIKDKRVVGELKPQEMLQLLDGL